ncbi:MAG: Hsp20/alpha crystallin family protein [Chthonomonas sp.]|nr:Hsp20/alpha crystallin family protein [Chthonomonas sp.]
MSSKERDEWLWQVGTQLQRLSEELANHAPRVARGLGWAPRVDIVESETHVFVRSEVAGVDPAEMRICIYPDRNVLVLRGRRDDPGFGPGRAGAHTLEIFFGEFEREVQLPQVELALGMLEAEIHNGMLMISVPKAPQGANIAVRRTIRVKRIV